MKRLATLSLLLMLVFGLAAATISVGTIAGSTNHFPVHTGYSYNYTQQIYTQPQINHAGEISKIKFYHHSSHPNSFSGSHEWVIYMGHTGRNSFASTADWEPVANLVQVFSGSVLANFPPSERWMEISLDVPFCYDNINNLIVAIHESTPGLHYGVYWGSFASGSNTGLSLPHNSFDPDINNPPNASLLTGNLASIQLVFPDTQVPQAPTLLNPANDAFVIGNDVLEWSLPLGSADADGYDVYIDGSLVSANQASSRYPISELAAGTHTWQVMARNSIGTSMPSETRSFTTPAEVSNGSVNLGLPVAPASFFSNTQSIYLQSEIASGIQGAQRIERIAYYWNGAAEAQNCNDWIIFMGHTDREVFAHDTAWVNLSQMVQVFAGHLELPAVPGWIEIDLDTPFAYNNTDNLLLSIYEISAFSEPTGIPHYFHSTATPGQNRSLRCYRLDYHPETGEPYDAERIAGYPNMLLWFTPLPDTPSLLLSPPALDFGVVKNGGSAGPLRVRAINAGAGTLNLTAGDISIIGPAAASFSFNPVNLPASLASGQSVYIPVNVSGVTAGEISATLRIVFQGQNHDVELRAEVLSASTVTIGTERLQCDLDTPFSTNSQWFASAALYTAPQINITGNLYMLGWNCSRTSAVPITYKIWAKNTSATQIPHTQLQNVMTDMTLIKEGTFTPNTLGWQVFQLDTPFAYTGGSLMVVVETYTDADTLGAGRQMYKNTYRALRDLYWAGTQPDPESYGTTCSYVPDIMLHISASLVNDIAAESVSGSSVPTMGEVSNYTVRLRNHGSNAQSNYQVKLMDADNTELANVNGPPIGGLQSLDVAVPWTPTTPGLLTIHAKTQLIGDELIQNDESTIMQVEVQPAGTQAVTIGAGDEQSAYPMALNGDKSIFQSIYLADELGFGSGTINSLVLYNNFYFRNPNVATQIYLGSTDQVNLSAGFITASQLTLVYDGTITYPEGHNAIPIHFQTPYVHAGGNLVLLFHYPQHAGVCVDYNYFRCQTMGNNRARYVNSSNALDPFNPPAGTLTGQFPQTTFLYHPGTPVNDLAALHLTGDHAPTAGSVSNYTVRLRNHGSATQSAYTVKLVNSSGVELASVVGAPINSAQILDVVIPWTPTAAGPVAIYGKVELAGDEFAPNDQTRAMHLQVHPESAETVTIGAGNQLSTFPIDFSEPCSIYQTIYSFQELGFVSGTITSLALYNDFFAQIPNAFTKIHLGSTDRPDMSSGYIPTSELSLVFEGLISYPAGENTILIHLQTPYVHRGGNLVVMFSCPANSYQYPGDYRFRCQSVGQNRAFYAHTDFEAYPSDPDTGSLTAIYPKITFHYNAHLLETDLAAWRIRGNLTPSVGLPSPYTVRISNYGIGVQTAYNVKLMDAGDQVLASMAGPPINSMQNLDLTLLWTPATVGNHTIYATIEMDGDQHTANNRTKDFDLTVYPEGVFAVTVGEGYRNGRYPIDMSTEVSLFQTLYYPDEMEGFVGQITALKLYNESQIEIPAVPISIWLGTTTQSDLTDGYIPPDQLTPVFHGSIDFPRGQNVIDIALDQPVMYLDGSNLVMMVYKSMANSIEPWNFFRCQPDGSNRSLYNSATVSDNIDPASPPQGTLSAQFPQTTFMLIPGEVGQVAGTVTAANGQPIANAELSINDGLFHTVTDDAGQYQFPQVLILPETYTLTITAYGYFDHTRSFELAADQQLTINASLQPLPQVSVSGTILGSDTQAPISGATINLSGYGSHTTNTDAQGCFTLAIYGHHTYQYEISAAGYSVMNGQFSLDDTDCDLGNIILEEPAYPPLNVTAVLNLANDSVDITWTAPERGRRIIGDMVGAGNAQKAAASDAKFRLQQVDPSRSKPGFSRSRPASGGSKAFIGYMVYRLETRYEQNQDAWELLSPEPISELSLQDSRWTLLPSGHYRWAVKSIYTNGVTSVAGMSNVLQRDVPSGTIMGRVRNTENAPIAGATITNGAVRTTSNPAGIYALPVPVGTHTVTASAPGYKRQTIENVVVNLNLPTTVDFVLEEGTPTDDPQIPVAATALNGNYPNPFNPETTISYSVKEPGRVALEIYNIKGQLVRNLVDSDHVSGHYKQLFNARDNRGRRISSGVYLIRMSAPGYQKTSKMILMQ